MWGGPPGPRGTPSSRVRENESNILQGAIRPARGSALLLRRATIGHQIQITPRRILLAEDKLYKAEYQGSGTFIISKPKRKKSKARQSQLKNPQRGSRK